MPLEIFCFRNRTTGALRSSSTCFPSWPYELARRLPYCRPQPLRRRARSAAGHCAGPALFGCSHLFVLGSSFFMLIRSRTPDPLPLLYSNRYPCGGRHTLAPVSITGVFSRSSPVPLSSLRSAPAIPPHGASARKTEDLGPAGSCILVVFTFFSFWVILMGYAIVTRARAPLDRVHRFTTPSCAASWPFKLLPSSCSRSAFS